MATLRPRGWMILADLLAAAPASAARALRAGHVACGLLLGLATLACAAEPEATPGPAKPMLPHAQQLIADKKPVRVVLYGDSISEVAPGWNGGAKTPETNWGAVLVKRLGEAYPGSTFTVHHFAIGGQNSYEGLGRLNGLEAFRPDLVLVAFGANDCCHHYHGSKYANTMIRF